MKKVLLTGANGFVGHNAISPLIKEGYEVHAVYSKNQNNERQDVHWHCADLLNNKDTARLIDLVRPTHLLHFAWYAEHGKFWNSLENYRWIEASIFLLRHFHDAGGQRVVMAGTCAEYDWLHGYCKEGITPCRPATPYGVCKNALQDLLHSYSSVEELSSAWGRIFNLYGPNECSSRLVSSVINSLLNGNKVRCTDGNQLRDYMHVEDVADAFVALLNSEVKGVVNIASGQPIAVKNVINKIVQKLGRMELVEFGAFPRPANDPPLLVADVVRLSEEVNWTPSFDIDSGLEQTIRIIKAQHNSRRSKLAANSG